MSIRSRLSPLVALTLLAGCGSSPPAYQKPLNATTTLMCPTPGDLPFKLATTGWHSQDNAELVSKDPRPNDAASDTLGNAGGMHANIYLADTGSPETGVFSYIGSKARTAADAGILVTPLPNEWVSLFVYDDTRSEWHFLERQETASDGSYNMFGTDFIGANGQPIYSMLEADGSCAVHYDWQWAPGTKVVVADLDGTLTLSDAELTMQLGNESYQPMQMGAANTLMQTWAAKGYQVVYLSARLHAYRPETFEWLQALGFPQGPVITCNHGGDPTAYKTAWMKRMIATFGWNVVAAYGNMDTDIAAYQAAGMPNNEIFIVGPFGGDLGSTPIANMDFTDHIDNYVDAQPDAN